ncbi:MAG: hypothetical protein M1453_04625, partial [Acidobacteria bacterium]|nr:hypothetical protein [Acidobacteriota bacterium]
SSDGRITSKDIEEATSWGERLNVPDYDSLVEALRRISTSDSPISEVDKITIRNFSVKYVLALFGKTGLDRVYSGEQWRVEMYEHLVRNISGFKLLGSVHSFDYKYFTKGAAVEKPKFAHPIHLEEFEFVKEHTKKEIKIPITGPYTVVDWSFNEFYETQLRKRYAKKRRIDLRRTYFEARRRFILDLVKNALRPELELLIQNGAEWIQIDEPAITTRPDAEEMELFVEATNSLTRGLKCTFSLHNCYSDYKLLAHYASRLKDVSQLALEFANRDSTNVGVDSDSRPGYSDLQHFVDEGYDGSFGLGVTHVHDFSGPSGSGATVEGRNIIESPELVRDRILFAAKLLHDPSKISVNPDCGLRTRSWDVIYKKLQAMMEGTKLARKEIS